MSLSSSKLSAKSRLLTVLLTISQTMALSSWTVVSIFIVGAFIVGILCSSTLREFGLKPDMTTNIAQMVLSSLVYVTGLIILLIEPYGVRRMNLKQIKALVGVIKAPQLRDVGYAFVAVAAYMILSILLMIVANTIMHIIAPGVNMNQEQAIGFTQRDTMLDILIAFITIVIVAPFIEELVFRGYLFGSLRERMPWWLGASIVSIVFGVVHGQWNVGVDVFAMSMVACFLRQKTGTIWAGVGLHMLKNLTAFSVLFLIPEPLRQLLMHL